MKDFQDKTAVITGGASGIGRALAEHAAQLGMNIVIADIDSAALEATRSALNTAEVCTVVCDVSQAEEVEALAEKTQARFGAAHLLCNNAGVSGGGSMEETSLEDWEWVLAVNLWGVIHGVRTFLPQMLAQGEGHIVNTASIAGVTSCPDLGPYNVSKHGVVTLSETLYSELRNKESRVGVSVLCPSYVQTRIHLSERSRPQTHGRSEEERTQAMKSAEETFAEFFAQAQPPARTAQLVFEAVRDERFYIFTHKGSCEKVVERMRAIAEDGHPPMRGPEEFPMAGL